jgi:hypothetical protein
MRKSMLGMLTLALVGARAHRHPGPGQALPRREPGDDPHEFDPYPYATGS